MRPEDVPMFTAAILPVIAAYRLNDGQATIDAYWGGLSDLPLETVQAACLLALRVEIEYITPAKLRALAVRPTNPIDPAEEWEKVKRLAANPHALELTDPAAIQAYRELGGRSTLKMLTDEQMDFKRREFIGRCKELAKKRQEPHQAPLFLEAPDEG